MKKYLYIFAWLLLACSCTDLSEYEADIDDIKNQIEQIRKDCEKINEKIESMQALASQVQARESITGISEILDDAGNVTGYVITFKNAETISFNLPADAPADDDPHEVIISIIKDNDGFWWTLNGEYMLDAQGKRLPASMSGQTPELKIDNDKWLVSVDGGKTWDDLEIASSDVVTAVGVASVTKTDDEVTFVLTDGTSFTIPMSKAATLSLSYSKNVVPGSTASVSYSFSSSTGVAKISVFGNKYIGKVSVNHYPAYGNGTIKVEINENYDVSMQKLFVYMDYGEGTLTQLLTFTEKGVFEVSSVAPLPASGGDFDLEIEIVDYYGYYINILSGAEWLSNSGGTTFTAAPNTGTSARTAAISVEARDKYNTTLFSKTVYVVQFGSDSFPVYQEYVGVWKMNGNDRINGGSFSRTIEIKKDNEATDGYLIYGLSPASGVDYAVKAQYNKSTGNLELKLPQTDLEGADIGLYPVTMNGSEPVVSTTAKTFTFTSNSSKNTMSSSMDYYNSFMFMDESGASLEPVSSDKVFYYNVSFERQGVAQYYKDGDVVMLNRATAGFTPLNIVIVGDGYQQKDLREGGKFEKSARSAMNSFFAIEPYKSFKDRFDVYMLTYASNDEGTDVTSSGVTKDTYFSSVCAGGGNTLVTCNYQTVLDAVTSRTGLTEANYGLYRTIVILLVNTTEQSGTCWYSKQGKVDASKVGDGIKSYAIAMLAADTMGASGLVKHEGGGHAFGRLADEYNWGGTADDAKKQNLANEQNNNGFYWNVSSTTGSSSPWARFIGRAGYEDVGYFEGAWGCSSGLYRPTQNSIMLNNQGNFNAPSREIIYKRIILQSEGQGSYSFDRFLEYDKRNI
jgi:hypothetical protein